VCVLYGTRVVVSVQPLPHEHSLEVVMTRTKHVRAKRGTAQVGRHNRLGPREIRALLLLAWATYLSTNQLHRGAGYTTPRRAQRRLRVPLDHGLTHVVLQSEAMHRPSLHLLTSAGCEYLIEHGLADARLRPGRPPRAQKRRHGLLIRDVFVEFLHAEIRGALTLEDFQFDSDLTRDPLNEEHGLIADGLAIVREPNGAGRIFGIECDTGEESTKTLRNKFSRWRTALDEWRRERCTLFIVATGESRLRTIGLILRETGLNDCAFTILSKDIAQAIEAMTTPHDHAARPGRSERRSVVAQLPRLRVISSRPNSAFRHQQ
jgi:hypothetical protein